MSEAVRLRGATKRFGSLVALDSVDLDIHRGEVFALLGPNGAGKTTLISLVAGTGLASSGTVEVLGHDVVRDYRFTRRAVGLVPQEINFDPFFTVQETLEFQAGYFGVRLSEERLVDILKNLSLLDKRHANARTLSGGMKRRLLIAKALVHRPPVLFLDEPTAGVDVELRRDLWTYVKRLAGEGTTVVLTTHYLEEAEELADRIGVIRNGKLLVVEDKLELLARYSKRTVRLALEQPVAELPVALQQSGLALADGGAVVVLTPRMGERLSAPLNAIAASGLRVADVQTREPKLESVIIELLHSTSPVLATPGNGATARERPVPPQPLPAPPSESTLGPRTLYRKEVKRFMRVPGQTILSPLITTALYFVVFGWSLGGRVREVEGVPYIRFLVPGLVMLGIINNAFLNTSSSMFIMKLQGTIVDLLVTPLTYLEILFGFLAAGTTRALIVGGLTWATAALFVGPHVPHPVQAVIAGVLVSVAFSAAGLIVALWADRFEQVNFIPTFVITPLAFLGGVFYSAAMLPAGFRLVLHLNPIYYMIESMRSALIGVHEQPPLVGFVVLFALTALMVGWALWLLKRGYKLRA
ncbi:MAG TPA: ABC transporter permease [Myxococcales bacterium]|nr:ABC transporter permease [Myxococcales bacterium]